MAIFLLLLSTFSFAETYHCQATNPAAEVTVETAKPSLTLFFPDKKESLELIDDTFLGLYTDPPIWALRSECQLKKTSAPNDENYFYCLLQDEGSVIGKIEATLKIDPVTKSGRYFGGAYGVSLKDVSKETFSIEFANCH